MNNFNLKKVQTRNIFCSNIRHNSDVYNLKSFLINWNTLKPISGSCRLFKEATGEYILRFVNEYFEDQQDFISDPSNPNVLFTHIPILTDVNYLDSRPEKIYLMFGESKAYYKDEAGEWRHLLAFEENIYNFVATQITSAESQLKNFNFYVIRDDSLNQKHKILFLSTDGEALDNYAVIEPDNSSSCLRKTSSSSAELNQTEIDEIVRLMNIENIHCYNFEYAGFLTVDENQPNITKKSNLLEKFDLKEKTVELFRVPNTLYVFYVATNKAAEDTKQKLSQKEIGIIIIVCLCVLLIILIVLIIWISGLCRKKNKAESESEGRNADYVPRSEYTDAYSHLYHLYVDRVPDSDTSNNCSNQSENSQKSAPQPSAYNADDAKRSNRRSRSSEHPTRTPESLKPDGATKSNRNSKNSKRSSMKSEILKHDGATKSKRNSKSSKRSSMKSESLKPDGATKSKRNSKRSKDPARKSETPKPDGAMESKQHPKDQRIQ